MKGPNPFTLWEEDPEKIYGRKEETRLFNSFLSSTTAAQGGLLVVSGGPGTGKTALMRYFAILAERNKILAPFVRVERGESMQVLADKLQHEISSSARHTYGLEELVDMASGENKHFGTIFFIDGIDKMKKANDAISRITEICRKNWNRKNIAFVLSSVKEFRTDPELAKTMLLKPFEEHEARELVEKSLGKDIKMGDECFNTIMKDTGGNPRLFKNVCYYIYEKLRDNEKVISKGHYLAYLPHIMSMLSREWFGRMYQDIPTAEREVLVSIARNDVMHVSDIAKALGKKLGPVTALVGRLKDRGQVVKLDRGRYQVFTKLYARYVISRS